jgi:DNA-directed RNA polymerase subunit RPC12/RpoP
MGIRDSLSGLRKALTPVNKGYTESTTRPSVAQPYMATDTGAKLPIFPFPLIMIYELADNIDALRIPIETLNREMFKNGWEITQRFKYKCNQCSKEFQYAPNIEVTGEDAKVAAKVQCDSCQSYDLRVPVPEHRKLLEDLISNPVNGNTQNLEDVARQLERDLEIADNAYLLMLKNYFIDDVTGEIDQSKTEIKELLSNDCRL